MLLMQNIVSIYIYKWEGKEKIVNECYITYSHKQQLFTLNFKTINFSICIQEHWIYRELRAQSCKYLHTYATSLAQAEMSQCAESRTTDGNVSCLRGQVFPGSSLMIFWSIFDYAMVSVVLKHESFHQSGLKS